VSSRKRNQNTILNYVDNVKGGQVRLLQLSGGSGGIAGTGQNEEVTYWNESGEVTGSSDLKWDGALIISGAINTQLVVSSNDQGQGILYSSHVNNPNVASMTIRRSRGTRESPSSVNDGDNLGAFRFQGYAGGYGTIADMRAAVEGPVSSGIIPTALEFRNTNYAGALGIRMVLDPTGSLGIGINPPLARLHLETDTAILPFLFERTDAPAKITGDFGGGNSAIKYTVNGVASYLMGIDDADGDKFKLAYGSADNAAFGTNDWITADTSGQVGIGIATPEAKLHIETTANNPALLIGDGNNNLAFERYSSVETDIPGSGFGMRIKTAPNGHLLVDLSGNDNADGFYIRVPTVPAIGALPDKVAFVANVGRQVGINLAVPRVNLDVSGALALRAPESTPATGSIVEARMFYDPDLQSLKISEDRRAYRRAFAYPDLLSLTIDSSSNSSAALYNVFDEDNYSSFVEDADYQFNTVSQHIYYNSSTGEFTVGADGIYDIKLILVLLGGTSGTVSVLVSQNGNTIFSADPFLHTALDPLERTVIFQRYLEAGDVLTVEVDGAVGTVTVSPGTTINIQKVADPVSSHISVTTLEETLATAGAFDPFDETYYTGTAFVSGTEYQHNCNPKDAVLTGSSGRFVFERSGLYNLLTTLTLETSTGSPQLGELRYYKNGTQIYTQETAIHASTDPQERTMSLITSIDRDDYINVEVEADANSWSVHSGSTFNAYRVDVRNEFTPQLASITLLTDTPLSGTTFNPYNSSNHASYTPGVNWTPNHSLHEEIGDIVRYNDSNGRFVVRQRGSFLIEVVLVLLHTSSNFVGIEIVKNNTTTVYQASPYVHSSVDPAERTIAIIVDAAGSDYFEVRVTGTNTVSVNAGSTFNIRRIH